MPATIELCNNRAEVVGVAIVNVADHEQLMQHRWCLNNGYAFRSERGKSIYMHRQLCPTDPSLEVDHKNGNKLDNRRRNLRPVTKSQQQQNVSAHKDSKSKYRGVSYDSKRDKWCAEASCMGKRRRKRCDTEIEAARVAKQFRKELMTHAEG